MCIYSNVPGETLRESLETNELTKVKATDIETTQTICTASQLTCFYMKGTLVSSRLNY